MSRTVCLAPANTVGYPQGGGHLWVYLNWALALRAAGCRVIWLEGVDDTAGGGDASVARRRRWRGRDVRECVAALKAHLGRFGLSDALALYSIDGTPLPADLAAAGLDLDAAADADLLLNLSHALPAAVVGRFRRSAFVDTDPGLFQVWMTTGDICVARHDIYFTIGETVGTPAARFPDCGLRWHYTPPPVFLAEWPVVRADFAFYHHHALVGRDVRVRGHDVLEREAGRLPRVRRSPVPHVRAARAGRVPGPTVRRMARAARRDGLGRARGMGRQRHARAVSRLHPVVARRIQLRQALLRAVREQLDQ